MTKPHIHCPVNGWDCPYFDANGVCMMYPESDPLQECDDFAFFWEEGEDYICYDDHENEQELLELGYHFINGEPVMPPNKEEIGGKSNERTD